MRWKSRWPTPPPNRSMPPRRRSNCCAWRHRALDFHNRNLVSDVGCAAEFAYAALAACAYNVRINHRFMHDLPAIEAQSHALERYEREGSALLASVRKAVRSQLERPAPGASG